MCGLQPGAGAFHRFPSATRRIRPIATAAAGAGVLAGCGALYVHQKNTAEVDKRVLPGFLADCLCGAAGEVVSLAVLYPLDTIKVRCQAEGKRAREVIAQLIKDGVGIQLVRKLWAGFTAGLLCSAVVGAVHFAAYSCARKWLLPITCPSCKPEPANHAPAPHGTAPGACSVPDVHTRTHAASDNAPEDKETAPGKLAATLLAAVFAAAMTAMVESPVELFRHNAQAGTMPSNFITSMYTTARREGVVRGLYWGFLPHCFEAMPHDVSELMVYGAMRDFHADAQHLSSPHHASMSCIPVHAWDLLTGAASGTAAVLVSMPLDVIKTYMQTHGTDLTGKGIISSASLFINTGQKLVRRGGFGALYLGVTPRLIQQVPSAMVCWWSIEALSRALEPHTVQHREQGTIGIAGSASAFEATTAAVAVCAAGKQENVCSGS